MKCRILKLLGAQSNALYLINCIVLSRKVNVSNAENTLRYHQRATSGQSEKLSWSLKPVSYLALWLSLKKCKHSNAEWSALVPLRTWALSRYSLRFCFLSLCWFKFGRRSVFPQTMWKEQKFGETSVRTLHDTKNETCLFCSHIVPTNTEIQLIPHTNAWQHFLALLLSFTMQLPQLIFIQWNCGNSICRLAEPI